MGYGIPNDIKEITDIILNRIYRYALAYYPMIRVLLYSSGRTILHNIITKRFIAMQNQGNIRLERNQWVRCG